MVQTKTPTVLQSELLSRPDKLSPQILFYSGISACHLYFLFFKLHLTTFLSAGYCTESLVMGSFLISALQWSEYWIHLVTLFSQTSFRRSNLPTPSPLFHFPCPCSCLPLFLHSSVAFPNQPLGSRDWLQMYLGITVLASSCNADQFFHVFKTETEIKQGSILARNPVQHLQGIILISYCLNGYLSFEFPPRGTRSRKHLCYALHCVLQVACLWWSISSSCQTCLPSSVPGVPLCTVSLVLCSGPVCWLRCLRQHN